jgi:hypothetical protein
MIIFVVSVALLTLCNLATFLLSLPSNLMAEKRDARRESSATNKTILLTVGDSSVEQKNAPLMIEIIYVRLATHLRFYVGVLDCQIQVKINQIIIITIY